MKYARFAGRPMRWAMGAAIAGLLGVASVRAQAPQEPAPLMTEQLFRNIEDSEGVIAV